MTINHFKRPLKEFLLKNVVYFVILKLVTGKRYFLIKKENIMLDDLWKWLFGHK